MSQAPDLEAILHAFAEETMGDDAILADYVRRYPHYASELVDFAQELRAVEVDAAVPYTPDETWEDQSWARFAKAVGVGAAPVAAADPFARLTSAEQVEMRQALGVPSMVFNAFRDRQVDAGSVPRPFLARLAELLSVAIDELKSCLALPERFDPAVQYKTDGKPAVAASKVTFADLLDQAMVTPERRAALLRDED